MERSQESRHLPSWELRADDGGLSLESAPRGLLVSLCGLKSAGNPKSNVTCGKSSRSWGTCPPICTRGDPIHTVHQGHLLP